MTYTEKENFLFSIHLAVGVQLNAKENDVYVGL